MCKVCEKHGAAGKWYLNAQNYLKETAEEANAYEYLEHLWGNLENFYINKVYGLLSMKWMAKKVKTPLLGRFLKWYANRGFLKEKNLNVKAAQGHFGMVVPLEEAKKILTEVVVEAESPIVKSICPCKYFNRGKRETTCLGFSPLIEVLPKLPRFIPKNGMEIIDPDEAAEYIDNLNKEKNYVSTIWCGPIPAVAALCNCDLNSCGALRLRQFGVNACLKAEYIAVLNPDKCIGCGECASRCQFGALSFSPLLSMPIIDPERCFGCGNCSNICEENAIELIERNEISQMRGKY
ncbi:MAG: hypothetical protein EU549_02345 [Promethearchaeota archaeon]|nr:MAG: hypothetical protein EU549_02345 [Candidatus Lokiarchaeota archaeon]